VFSFSFGAAKRLSESLSQKVKSPGVLVVLVVLLPGTCSWYTEWSKAFICKV